MHDAGQGRTRLGARLALCAMALCVILLPLFLTRNVGYLFEADSPWMLQPAHGLDWDGEPGPATPVRWTHPSWALDAAPNEAPPSGAPEKALNDGILPGAGGEGSAGADFGSGGWSDGRLVLGSWWPRMSIRSGHDALPIVTEAYQGGWLYWPFKLLSMESRRLPAIRLFAALLGGLTLLLAFLALRAWWGRASLPLAALLACNSMFLLSFGFGYLYEALPMTALLAAVLAAGRVRARPTVGGTLAVAFLAGLAGGLKLTALPAAAVVTGVLLGTGTLRHRRRALAFLVGLGLPLLPFLASESAAALAGLPSPLLSALGGGKGGLSEPVGMLSGFFMSSVWTAALPAGNGYILPMLSSGASPAPWLLGLSAAVSLPGLALAVRRWRRVDADPLRDAVLAGWVVVLVLSGVLYKSGFDFQAFMTVHPLVASLIVQSLLEEGRSCAAGPARRFWKAAAVAFVAVVLVHTGISLAGGGRVTTVVSLRGQEEIASKLPEGRVVLTTSYNQAGMLRMMTGGRVSEIHMDRLLSPGGNEAFYRLTVRHAFAEVILRHPGALYLFDLAPLPIDESREHTSFARGIGSRQVVAQEFVQAAREAGMFSRTVAVGHGDAGNGVLALVELRKIPGP